MRKRWLRTRMWCMLWWWYVTWWPSPTTRSSCSIRPWWITKSWVDWIVSTCWWTKAFRVCWELTVSWIRPSKIMQRRSFKTLDHSYSRSMRGWASWIVTRMRTTSTGKEPRSTQQRLKKGTTYTMVRPTASTSRRAWTTSAYTSRKTKTATEETSENVYSIL